MRYHRQRPRISEVFNPHTAPHPEVFAARTDGDSERLQDAATEALLKPGEHLVLWGFTGVGKTSLLVYLAEKLRLPYLTVQARAPLDDRSAATVLLENALADLGYEEAFHTRRSSDSSVSMDFGVAKAKAGIGYKASAEVLSAIHSNSLDRALVKALAASQYRLLFIDGFEFIPLAELPRTRTMLWTLMHELSDLASKNPRVAKVVTAGVAEAADELVPADGPVARRVYQLHVPRMSDAQLSDILHRGATLLKLRFEPDAEWAIIRASDGFPFYTHHFAFHAIQQARRQVSPDRVETVSYIDYERSLDTAIKGAQLRLAKPYLSAVEPTRTRQVRKNVLEALAEQDRFTASLDDIRHAYLRLFPDEVDAARSGFFQRPLVQLANDFGILTQIRASGANRGMVYRFRDPLMRAYVRLHRQHPHLTDFTREELIAA